MANCDYETTTTVKLTPEQIHTALKTHFNMDQKSSVVFSIDPAGFPKIIGATITHTEHIKKSTGSTWR